MQYAIVHSVQWLQDLNCIAGQADYCATAVITTPIIVDNQDSDANANVRLRLKRARGNGRNTN
jgi:hypothetical protein